jgi:hypothetical protein
VFNSRNARLEAAFLFTPFLFQSRLEIENEGLTSCILILKTLASGRVFLFPGLFFHEFFSSGGSFVNASPGKYDPTTNQPLLFTAVQS